MYAIREMLPDDLSAFEVLWQERVRWAAGRGIGPISYTPLTAKERAAAVPVLLTSDGKIVAAATIVTPPPPAGPARDQDAQSAFDLAHLITTTEQSHVPLPWIVTAWVGDLAARTGHSWLRIQIAPARLAEHMCSQLGWRLVSTAPTAHGGTLHHLQQEANASPGIHALVRTASTPSSQNTARRPSPVAEPQAPARQQPH